MDEFDKRVESFLSYLWKVTPQRSPNSRILVSRNKREGLYEGKNFIQGVKRHRRGGRPAGRVDFADLGIQLHNPLEAQNGTVIPKTGA